MYSDAKKNRQMPRLTIWESNCRERTIFFRYSSIASRRGYEFTSIKAKLWKWYLVPIPVRHERRERFSRDASRRISLTRVSKLLRLALISTGLSIPEGRYAKGAFRRRRNHSRTFVLSLNERRITLSLSLYSRLCWIKRGKDHAQSSSAKVVSNRAESSSDHSHIYKPTGRTAWKLQARDALSWLVLSAGHGPRGDGKIAATKLAWASSRETLFPRFHIQVCARTKGTDARRVYVGTAVKNAWNTLAGGFSISLH